MDARTVLILGLISGGLWVTEKSAHLVTKAAHQTKAAVHHVLHRGHKKAGTK